MHKFTHIDVRTHTIRTYIYVHTQYSFTYTHTQSVRAKWKSTDDMYDARIIRCNSDGTYAVMYSDGDRDENCPERNIYSLDINAKQKQQTIFENDPDVSFPKYHLSNHEANFQVGRRAYALCLSIGMHEGKKEEKEGIGIEEEL